MPASLARWIPATSMLLVSLISYIDRNTLALLIPTIMKETHLSAEQYGFIVSAFSVAYMVSNPVWGRLLDRFGLRAGMMAAVAFWTVGTMAPSIARGFLTFGIARTALGLGEGATFPGGLRAGVQTLPPAEQARGLAVAYSGGSLGAIITPIIVTPIFLRWGWRPAFLFTGGVWVALLGVWVFFVPPPPSGRFHPPHPSLGASPPLAAPPVSGFVLAFLLGGT